MSERKASETETKKWKSDRAKNNSAHKALLERKALAIRQDSEKERGREQMPRRQQERRGQRLRERTRKIQRERGRVWRRVKQKQKIAKASERKTRAQKTKQTNERESELTSLQTQHEKTLP